MTVDVCRATGWSLRDVDEAELESLLEFIGYEDPDVIIIGGKRYRRASAERAKALA